jgi:hypothetical protein
VADRLRAYDIFTPSSFPEHTYVERDEAHLEAHLGQALSTPGQIASLSGPSKCGKTVLVQRTVGRDYLIKVSGASLRAPEDLWTKVLDWIGAPSTMSATDTDGTADSATTTGKSNAGFPGVVGFEATGAKGKSQSLQSSTTITAARAGLPQVLREIGDSEWVVFIDDFHYMARDLQSDVAKQLKEAAEQRLRICTASVPHRADDVVRALPELRGRVTAIDMTYWRREELEAIPALGFPKLNATLKPDAARRLAAEVAGSPQLMQSVCLNVALDAGIDVSRAAHTEIALPDATIEAVLRRTANSTDFRSLAEVIRGGPKTRGRDRTEYNFRNGTTGDVYDCVVNAIALDPPRLTFPYDDLTARVRKLCDGEAPSGSSIVTSCKHVCRLARTRMPNERAIEWDDSKQVLDIPDPLLLFYLRWGAV